MNTASPLYFPLVALVVSIPIVGSGITLVLHSRLQRFVATVRYIESHAHLKILRDVASVAMYAALVQMLLLFAPLLFYVYGAATGVFNLNDALYVIVPGGLHLWTYVRYRQIEAKAQSVNVDNPAILQDVIHVVETWKRKTLPDW